MAAGDETLLGDHKCEVEKCLGATTWYPANTGYFRGGGYSSGFLTRGGIPITMARLNLVKGLGPVLQLAEGWTVDLPPKVHETLNERTIPPGPHTGSPTPDRQRPVPRCVLGDGELGANHGAASYGHIGADLIALAALLRIPVSMHNLPEEQIYRPSAWNAFGTTDLESAGLPRLCQLWAIVRVKTAI